MKESDITAFLLVFDRYEINYGNSSDSGTSSEEWSIDWEYQSNSAGISHGYTVDNHYHKCSIISKYTISGHEFTELNKIDKKDGQYTEREALEIIVTHWKENESNT